MYKQEANIDGFLDSSLDFGSKLLKTGASLSEQYAKIRQIKKAKEALKKEKALEIQYQNLLAIEASAPAQRGKGIGTNLAIALGTILLGGIFIVTRK